MRKIGLILLAAVFAAACNNAAEETTTSDSTAVKDNTNVYDTGVGSSMTDTSKRIDTSSKMQDTATKK